MKQSDITPEIFKLMSPEDQARFGYVPAPPAPVQGKVKDYGWRQELKEQMLMKAWLERHEYAYTWSRTDKRTTGVLGIADFTIPALKLALEFKQPGRKLTDSQEIWRERHLRRGGIYEVVTSFEQGKTIVEKCDERQPI